MPKIESNTLINIDNFALKKSNAKSPISEIVNLVSRNVNKHKLNYNQLRFIMKRVREKCDIEYPKKVKKLPQMPSSTQIGDFYAQINNPIHKLIFEVLEGSGLRISELVKLKVSEIDFENNTLFIKQGKGHKDRIAIIGNKLTDKLKLYLEGRKNIYLFESNRHTKYTTRRIQQLCTKYAQLSGINEGLTCHTFRHLFITNLASNNISREVREIVAGHAKGSKAHDVYLHLSVGSAKDEIIKVLDGEKFDEN